MTKNDDRELRELFRQMRREDESRAPSFAALVQRARPATTWFPFRLLVPAAALVAALVVGISVTRDNGGGVGRPPGAAPSVTEWEAPTDFLLNTPGRELYRNLPRWGTGLPALDSGSGPARKHEERSKL